MRGQLNDARASTRGSPALAFASAVLCATGCWVFEDEPSEEKVCLDETTDLSPGDSFELTQRGETVELGPLLASVEGESSGTLLWTKVGRTTTVTLTVTAEQDAFVTAYGDCNGYHGVDIPAHLELETGDGVLAERFGGQLSLDEGGEVLFFPELVVPGPIERLEGVLPVGLDRTLGSDWQLVIRPELAPGPGLRFTSASLVLKHVGWAASDPAESLAVGQATFAGE